jgi:hypothetical protein
MGHRGRSGERRRGDRRGRARDRLGDGSEERRRGGRRRYAPAAVASVGYQVLLLLQAPSPGLLHARVTVPSAARAIVNVPPAADVAVTEKVFPVPLAAVSFVASSVCSTPLRPATSVL